MEDMLYAVHYHRRLWHLGELHDALDAQQLRAMGRAQEIKEHFQRAGRDCDVAGEHEGADMRVVPVAIEMLVLVIAMMLMVMIMMRLRIGIGFGGEPFLHVRNLPVRIVETAAQ